MASTFFVNGVTLSDAGWMNDGNELIYPTSMSGTALIAYWGTYTPTVTNGTNVAASTPRLATYLRVGNAVTVAGQVDIDPTAAAPTATDFELSLPIASNFSTTFQCGGTGCTDKNHGYCPVYIEAVIADDKPQFSFNATSAANQTVTYTYTYQVI